MESYSQDEDLSQDNLHSTTSHLTQSEFRLPQDTTEPSKGTKPPKWRKKKLISQKKKEIMAWAQSELERSEESSGFKKITSRKVGLSVNITESRMLETQLLGLAKARYHTIKEKNIQKNQFIDNQIRKCKSLPHLLENVNFQQYRQKSFNGVEIFKARSHRMKVTLLKQHYEEYLSEESEENLLQMTLPDILQLVEERKKCDANFVNDSREIKGVFVTIPEERTATTPSTQFKLPSLTLRQSHPPTPLPTNVDKTLLEIPVTPSRIPDPLRESAMGYNMLGLGRRQSFISRASFSHRKKSVIPPQVESKKTLPNIEDPRCKNLILSLVPFTDKGCRTTSGKTLPDLLTHIDSLKAEPGFFSKKTTEIHSNRPTPRLVVYQQ